MEVWWFWHMAKCTGHGDCLILLLSQIIVSLLRKKSNQYIHGKIFSFLKVIDMCLLNIYLEISWEKILLNMRHYKIIWDHLIHLINYPKIAFKMRFYERFLAVFYPDQLETLPVKPAIYAIERSVKCSQQPLHFAQHQRPTTLY